MVFFMIPSIDCVRAPSTRGRLAQQPRSRAFVGGRGRAFVSSALRRLRRARGSLASRGVASCRGRSRLLLKRNAAEDRSAELVSTLRLGESGGEALAPDALSSETAARALQIG